MLSLAGKSQYAHLAWTPVSKNFYQIQPSLVKVMLDHFRPVGSILTLTDPGKVVSNTLNQATSIHCVAHTEESDFYSTEWWRQQKTNWTHNWVVAPMLGTQEYNTYIYKYATEVAKHGVILLGRLSLLEPTKERREFLANHALTDMVVLNPRPNYRSVGSKKDSVTSCWFMFKKKENWADGTNITYALDWQQEFSGTALPPL